jgi:hypothetical protein
LATPRLNVRSTTWLLRVRLCSAHGADDWGKLNGWRVPEVIIQYISLHLTLPSHIPLSWGVGSLREDEWLVVRLSHAHTHIHEYRRPQFVLLIYYVHVTNPMDLCTYPLPWISNRPSSQPGIRRFTWLRCAEAERLTRARRIQLCILFTLRTFGWNMFMQSFFFLVLVLGMMHRVLESPRMRWGVGGVGCAYAVRSDYRCLECVVLGRLGKLKICCF